MEVVMSNGSVAAINANVAPTGPPGKPSIQYTVYPTGDPAQDVPNVREAVLAVDGGGTVVLESHRLGDPSGLVTPFDFGGDAEAGTIFLARNVHIEGHKHPDREWSDPKGWTAGVRPGGGTTITGGRQVFVAGLEIDPATGRPPIDPLTKVRVEIRKPVSVTIQDIRFDRSVRGAIRVHATSGHTEIRGCSFVNYVATSDTPAGAFPLVVDSRIAGNIVAPAAVAGQMDIRNNFFGPPPGAMTNNAIHVSNCNLKPLRFRNNRIEDTYFVGLAVYGNQGHTEVVENSIRKASTYVNPKIGVNEGAAIAAGVWVGPVKSPDGSFTIRGNAIEVSSPNSHGIVVFRFDATATVEVRDNEISMVANPNDVPERSALACLGAACRSHGKWQDNVVTGTGPFGIRVSQKKPPYTDKTAEVTQPDSDPGVPAIFAGNRLEGFAATTAQFFVAQGVRRLEVRDNHFGRVTGTNPANPYDNGKQGLPEPSPAGVWWSGEDGRISGNHFEASQIGGWTLAPFVGCFYFGPESARNEVDCRQKHFPPSGAASGGPAAVEANQIFDAGTANDITAK
jgi:hypothetical protein